MMLKLEKDKEMSLSEYSKLYDILISGDNFWRRLNAEVDFSFINEEIQTNYSLTMGRPSEYTVVFRRISHQSRKTEKHLQKR